MTVYTKTFYPAGPLNASPQVIYKHHNKANGTIKVPFPGTGKLVHVEAHTTEAVATAAFAIEIQNDAGTAIGDINVATSSSAVGDEDEWTKDASSESDYIFDNGHVKLVTASLSGTGELDLYFVFEPSMT